MQVQNPTASAGQTRTVLKKTEVRHEPRSITNGIDRSEEAAKRCQKQNRYVTKHYNINARKKGEKTHNPDLF